MKSWKEYTSKSKFRNTYSNGSDFICVTPEIAEEIRNITDNWLEARAIFNAEKDELQRLVEEGVITNELAAQRWFDNSKTKQIELMKKKARDEFKRSLRDLSSKEREKKIAVRNLVCAVYAKAIRNIMTTESQWREAQEIQRLAEMFHEVRR